MNLKRLWISINSSFAEGTDFAGFQQYASAVGDLFTFCLPPAQIPGVRKICIDLFDVPDAFWLRQLNNILYINETFAISQFSEADFHARMRLLCEAIYKILIHVYDEFNMDKSQLEAGYQKILNNNYQFEVTLCGGVKQNKIRQTKAIVTAVHYWGASLVKIDFLNKDNQIKNSFQLLKTIQGYFMYSMLIKSAKWISNDVFQISNPSGEINFRININGEITPYYLPANRDIDGIREEINTYAEDCFFEI